MPSLFTRTVDVKLRNRAAGRVRAVQIAVGVLSLSAPALLGGCAVGRLMPEAGSASVGTILHGSVHGGQQPVSGAQVDLWAAGTGGNGTASTDLITSTVLTDANGAFDITGQYTCPSASAQVYMTATGGNPGLAPGTNNGSLMLLAALGDCGSLSSVTNIQINELTTVAAAYGLAPFAAGFDHVASSQTNTAGLRSAMKTAMLLADSYNGGVPSATMPANGTMEAAKLITLGNVIGNCVNSDGGAPCSTLVSDSGAASGADTFRIALAVTQHPGDNVTAVFNDAPAHAAFGGALASAPNDWSMSISFTGGGLAQPNAVSSDAQGNLWVSNGQGGVSGFSAQGSPIFANGVTGPGMVQSASVMIDSSASVWMTNGSAGPAYPDGSVGKIGQDGTLQSGTYGFSSGVNSLPDSLAAAIDGTVWVANAGSSTVTLMEADGTVISGANGFGAGVLSSPSAIAVDGQGYAWVANRGSGQLVKMDTSGNVLVQSACCSTPDSLAIDSHGMLWVGDSSAGSLTQVRSDGSVVQALQSGSAVIRALTIDGGGHIFIPDAASGAFATLYDSGSANPGMLVGQTYGMGLDAQLNGPSGVSTDNSGNVWISSTNDNRLVEFVGMAVPVKAPRIGLPAQP